MRLRDDKVQLATRPNTCPHLAETLDRVLAMLEHMRGEGHIVEAQVYVSYAALDETWLDPAPEESAPPALQHVGTGIKQHQFRRVAATCNPCLRERGRSRADIQYPRTLQRNVSGCREEAEICIVIAKGAHLVGPTGRCCIVLTNETIYGGTHASVRRR
jgi:hypothetical protein